MNKKIISNDRVTTPLGMILLVCIIGLLVYIGIHGFQVGLNMPIYDSDQRDISFFVSAYYMMSIVAFVIATPLIIHFIFQFGYVIKGKKPVTSSVKKD